MVAPRLPYRTRSLAPLSGAAVLEVGDLRITYPGSTNLAVDGVNVVLPAGARLALIGPNGAGKSTLLKGIAGLLPIRSGTVRHFGRPVGSCLDRVAYLPQRGEIDWQFPITAHRLVTMGRYVHLGWMRRPGSRDRSIVERVMAELGLADLGGRQIGKLSGGQQQRVLLARALVQEADLILLDEPFNAIDARTRAAVAQVLEELRQAGKTVVTATHDLGDLAVNFDGALYLDEGRVVPAPAGAFAGVAFGWQG